MGAERKGTPLSLDIGQCMAHASEESYGLEITGSMSTSCLWDRSEEQEEGLKSVDDVKDEIQKNELLLKSMGNNLVDKGEKIKKKLRWLYALREEREKQQAVEASTLEKERKQASMKDFGDERTYNRVSGKISAVLSCTKKQLVNHDNHEQCKTSAFCEPIGMLKGLCNNGNTKMRIPEESNIMHMPPGGSRSRGQKDKSPIVVPSSSFYTSFRESKDFKNDNHSIQSKDLVASRVASGKRHRALSPHERKNKSSSLGTSSSCSTGGPKKATCEEVASSLKTRSRSHLYMCKNSLGGSLDTAMELSDDEERRGLDDAKSGIQQKDFSTNNSYCLRSNLVRREGFRVTYPSGDPEAVEVQQSDLKHLDDYEFLNDTVIDFYIKYLQRPEFLSQEKKGHFHFFNTFFFKKLLLEKICNDQVLAQRKRRKGDSYYSKLRKWTKGINIFEKSYLLVPVHDSSHWSLGIVCFARDDHERDDLAPYILHLDSMRDGHASEEIFQVLRRYLEAEWNHVRGDKNCSIVLRNFVCKRVEVPLQQNAWDCGLFLLYFIKCFLHDAKSIFKPHLLDSMFGRQWFKPQDASNLRKGIRLVLANLTQPLNDEIMMEDMD